MRLGEAVTFRYLRRHYFDDAKLRDLAISEFVRAMRSGRLIAFTGSLSTSPMGYPNWPKLVAEALKIARAELGKVPGEARSRAEKLIDTLAKVEDRDSRFDRRVTFSAVAQLLDHVSASDEATRKATAKIAALFQSPARPPGPPYQKIVEAIFNTLRIDRVLTTNYDFELEGHAMDMGLSVATSVPGPGASSPRGKAVTPYQWITERRSERWFDKDGLARDGYSLVLKLANGERIVSDMMHRERPEALIEFSIGCPENDKHIFHLHGRADHPEEMILSYRDYDRMYRRHTLGKVPFEHALRILFAGNPILFVGLGMDEPELNRTLEEFVGNNPYARKAPAFLIWNMPKPLPELKKGQADQEGFVSRRTEPYPEISTEERKAAFRLDKLHRLGILTLFADDLIVPSKRSFSGSAASQLHRSLIALAQRVFDAHTNRLARIPDPRWRHGHARIRSGFATGGGIIQSWHVEWRNAAKGYPGYDPDRLHGTFMNVLIAPPGAGKTAMALALAERWRKSCPAGTAVIINFNMRIDTDSILAFIAALFRYDGSGGPDGLDDCRRSREEQFLDPQCTGLKNRNPLLIVLKGIERIFDVNGHPLSAEFDQFLRSFIERLDQTVEVQFLVLGTDRIRGYFEGWRKHWIDREARNAKAAQPPAALVKIFVDSLRPPAGKSAPTYLDWLRSRHRSSKLDIARLVNKELDGYAAQRRTTYQTLLSPSALPSLGVQPDQADLAFDIISVMAFIGQPVERAVLFHAPRIQRRFTADTRTPAGLRKARKDFDTAFNALLDKRCKLVGEVNPNSGKTEPEKRYALHLSLQSEIRDRNGIPLSDAILSTAYNMSLFSAQPADGALPEADLHDELGHLIDWLVGAYKDPPYDSSVPVSRASGEAPRDAPHVAAAFRAAVSLVRGLYSMSALLSVDRGDRLVSEDRDGLLTEHAQRLDRILSAFDQIWRARGDKILARNAEPIYPDELVWLHNERGVVKLAQGDLYEARFSLNEAARINREYVEFGDESHNWRRITLNQIVVDIERGKLQAAEDRMNAIERKLGADKAEHIRREYLESSSPRRVRFDAVAAHEDILAMALITGYRGLTSHLRGELDAAERYYARAVRVLQRMDEQRALALFRRHKASLHSDLGDGPEMAKECRLSVSGAESVRQLDIVYASRVTAACAYDRSSDAAERRRGFRAAMEALEYAGLADLHRLSIEAQARLALAKFGNGDHNAALEHVSEAMATATRYGMTLHKIRLRTLMGRILIAQGSIESGRTLIRNSINGAVRIGYQRAIESARSALAETEA